ncbi:MAG: hypothetical protein ABI045_04260 [Flavobacteriales bacterium]
MIHLGMVEQEIVVVSRKGVVSEEGFSFEENGYNQAAPIDGYKSLFLLVLIVVEI